MYKLTPAQIHTELRAARMSEVTVTEDGLYIFVRLNPETAGLELLDTMQLE
jgi:hypothetical protein